MTFTTLILLIVLNMLLGIAHSVAYVTISGGTHFAFAIAHFTAIVLLTTVG